MAVLPVWRSPRIQLALTAPNRNERIDDLEPGLERHRDRGAIHDGRGRAFDGQTRPGGHRPVAIERPAQRIDDAPQQSVAHDHIHDPARALDLVAGVQMPVFAEQHDADFSLVHVERHADDIAGELYQLLEAHGGEAGDLGDAGGDAGDRANLPRRQLRRERFPHAADAGKSVVENTLQAFGLSAHWLLDPGQGAAGLSLAFASLLGAALASGSGSAFNSGLGSIFCGALGPGLSFSFRSSSTPFSSDVR